MSTNINRYKPDNDGRLWPAVDGEYVLYSDHISVLSASPAPQPVAVKDAHPADQIIGQIEALFPNWRSYRDLIDCIECTLHQLKKDAAHEA